MIRCLQYLPYLWLGRIFEICDHVERSTSDGVLGGLWLNVQWASGLECCSILSRNMSLPFGVGCCSSIQLFGPCVWSPCLRRLMRPLILFCRGTVTDLLDLPASGLNCLSHHCIIKSAHGIVDRLVGPWCTHCFHRVWFIEVYSLFVRVYLRGTPFGYWCAMESSGRCSALGYWVWHRSSGMILGLAPVRSGVNLLHFLDQSWNW